MKPKLPRIWIRTGKAIVISCLCCCRVLAQTDTTLGSLKQVEHRELTEFDQEINYFGKHNEYFTVRTIRKNGVLFRSDSYTLLPRILPSGIRLDSVSRIINHGPTKIMYPSGSQYVVCNYREGVLHGPFMAFYEDGAVKRKEYFKNGRITESRCFTPEGAPQKCEAFYQSSQFLGKPKDLQRYMRQKLDSLLDGDNVWEIMASLTINEIGQVVGVNVKVNARQSVDMQVPAIRSYVQQVVRNMPEWVPDKLNWKPALNDGKAVPSTWILSCYRNHGYLECLMWYKM